MRIHDENIKIRRTISTRTFLACAAIGAGLMYALDPASGVRRRALARDRITHIFAVLRKTARGKAKDIRNRSRGFLHEIARPFRDKKERFRRPDVFRAAKELETSQPVTDSGSVVEDTITSLIAICRESGGTYRRAAEILVNRPDLAHFFEEMADHRMLAADALEQRLIRATIRPAAANPAAGPFEGWTRLEHDSEPMDTIEICQEFEERTQKNFEQALRALPEEWRWELNEYSQHSRSALAKLHSWLEGKEGGAPPNRQRRRNRAAAKRLTSPDGAPSQEDE